MLKFRCPRCQSVLKAPEDRQGQHSTCPSCGLLLQVPRAGVTKPPPLPARPRRREEEEPEPRPVVSHPSWGPAVWLGAGSLGATGVGALFLCLPCFWLLSLPATGVGVVVGVIGLVVAIRTKQGLFLNVTALLVSLLCCLLSLILVLIMQAQLSQSLDELDRSLDRMEHRTW